MADRLQMANHLDSDVGDWPRQPVIGPPARVPLAFDPNTFIETPDYQRMGPGAGPGDPYIWRFWGWPYPRLMTREQSAKLERARLVQHRLTLPADSPERIRYFDELRCIDIDPGDIQESGTAFELVRVHLQKFGTGIVERLATVWDDVTALDEDGDPIFSFGPFLGTRPCRFPLVHPDPAAGELAVEFRLLVTEVPDFADTQSVGLPAYVGPASPFAIPADDNLRTPWRDNRQGYVVRWADLLQYVTGLHSLARMWVILSGQPDRWRIRMGGRLSGYWNSAGPMGVALDQATRRTL